MNPCSFSEKLPLFINEELFEAAEYEVEEHVESCTDCQHELEQLTGNDTIAVGSSMLLASRKMRHSAEPIDPQFVDRLLHEGPKVDLEVDPEADERTEPTSETPNQIGDYQIVREIGRGGMGVVYEAEQYSLRRRVALKVLPLFSHFRSEFRVRFQREARAAARMHHKNIVPVFEVGNEDGYFFYAMQLIQGGSLDQVIDQLRNVRSGSRFAKFAAQSDQPVSNQPVPGMVSAAEPVQANSSVQTNGPVQTNGIALSEHLSHSNSNAGHRRYCQSIAKIAYQMADALAYAHARGVIHRDIKPSNLILDEEGVVWVTDFGLAKTNDEGMTQTGDFLGTLRYMSPERFRGVCDEQTDVYALGITLYELLVLRPAFGQSDRLQLMDAIRQVDPPGLRTLDRRIPLDLETIVLKACHKEPQVRYANATELAEDLRRFLNDEPILARRTSLPERFARWSRKNKGLVFSLLGAVLLGAALVVSGMSGKGDRSQDNRNGAGRSTSPKAIAPHTIDIAQPHEFPSNSSHLHATPRVREIAAILLERGARIYSTTSTGTLGMSVPSDIPEGYFQIGIVDLTKAQPLEDSITLLQELPELSELWIKEAPLSEPMVQAISRTRALEVIELSDTDLDDAGLEHFIGMPHLGELNVGGTQVTSQAVKRFRGLHPKVAIDWHR